VISSASAQQKHIDTTSTSSVQEKVVAIPQTMSSALRAVVELRDLAEKTNTAVADLYRRVNLSDLERRTGFKVHEAVPALIDALADHYGMSWSHIAELVGVSAQAVRKWRKGEQATGGNRRSVARLAALMDLLTEMHIADPSQWLEVPLVPGYPITGLQLYRAGRVDLLLEWADKRIDKPEYVLDLFEPEWRDKYGSDYETFQAADGNLSIRRRG
jgi:DNA-binding transcriptional regulator YiaG